jgi:septation ring formation regulator EzrA
MFSIMELFPEATPVEVSETKYYLTNYRRFIKIINTLEEIPERTDEQQAKYSTLKGMTDKIERAVNLIQDEEVRKMIEMRYIRGIQHKFVLHRFSSIHQTTVDRRMNEGIKAIANTIKDIS